MVVKFHYWSNDLHRALSQLFATSCSTKTLCNIMVHRPNKRRQIGVKPVVGNKEKGRKKGGATGSGLRLCFNNKERGTNVGIFGKRKAHPRGKKNLGNK